MTTNSCTNPDSFKRYVETLRPPPGTDLTYRPEPMLLTSRQRRTVSRELRRLLQQREALRKRFVELNEACERAEDDDAISVERFSDMDKRRNELLAELNDANDAVHLFEPDSVADLSIVVGMARHLIATSEVHDDFLEHLLSAVERLVLGQRSISRRGRAEKGGAR